MTIPRIIDIIPRAITALFLGAALVVLCSVPPMMSSLAMIALLLVVLCGEWPSFHAWSLTLLYPILPTCALIALNMSAGRIDLLWICFIVCSHDTGAYLAGNVWGRTPLLPSISPKKSWEGLVGGLVCSCATACMIYFWAPPSPLQRLTPVIFLLTIIMLNIAGVCGDLFESWLKRRAGIKNSGWLLPGHGGILDRTDSILFAGSLWAVIRFLIIS